MIIKRTRNGQPNNSIDKKVAPKINKITKTQTESEKPTYVVKKKKGGCGCGKKKG